MFFPSHVRVFLAPGPTDMRKSIDALSLMVEDKLRADPLSGHLFVFSNKRGDKVKILYWDRNGFCLWYKRLERGIFRFPTVQEQVLTLSPNELNLILEGIDLTYGNRLRAVEFNTIK